MLLDPRSLPARPAVDPGDPPAGDPPAEIVRPLGAELFARRWLPNDPRCHGGDGLGPVYNASSCVDCHYLGAPGGAGSADRNVELATGIGYIRPPGEPAGIRAGPGGMFVNNGLDIVETRPVKDDLVRAHPGFRDGMSIVLHRYGVDPDYTRWREDFRSQSRTPRNIPMVSTGRLTVSTSRSARRHASLASSSRDQGLSIPPILAEQLEAACKQAASQFGMTDVAFTFTHRNTPPLFGTGLMDGVTDSELEYVARLEPSATRGRVHRLKDGRIGRFGWKAQVASLEDFVLTACANELGLEVPGHHQATSPLAPDATARGLDLTPAECDALVAYVRSLPAPVSVASVGRTGVGRYRGRPSGVPFRRVRGLPHAGPRPGPGPLQRPVAP